MPVNTNIVTLSEEFAQTRFDQVALAIDAGDAEEVRRLSELARAEYLPVHDGLRDVVGATLDFAARATSVEKGEAIGRRVIERMLGDSGDAPQYAQADLVERVKSIAAGWHWHGTHFQVSEDDDKITFRLDPCGSGMRLELDGRYDGPDGWLRSERGSPSTFMQSGFAMYSNHCAEMTRAGLAAGNATFVVEGWRERDCGVCFQHTYKRREAVPTETYERVGLEAPQPKPTPSQAERLFSKDGIEQLGTHPLERATTAVAVGELEVARAALAECREGWGISMHGAYLRWIAELWAEVTATLGEHSLPKLLATTAPELVRHRRGASSRDWAAFWAMHLGLESIGQRDADTEFRIQPTALLDPAAKVSPEQLVTGLNEGLNARGWSDVGTFGSARGSIVHVIAQV